MPNAIDPFSCSKALSEWSSQILMKQGVDEIYKWRMIEYWMQAELFRAVESNMAGAWRYFGAFEQPYYTAVPRSGSKYNVKWIDLVFAEPKLKKPERIVWIELKDIGRSAHTLISNARGLGQDLSALYMFDPSKTKEIWINPPEHVVDRGRTQEWKELCEGIKRANHLIAQIVLVPKNFMSETEQNQLIENWLATFRNRIAHVGQEPLVPIESDSTQQFAVFALVMKPICELHN